MFILNFPRNGRAKRERERVITFDTRDAALSPADPTDFI